MKEQSVALQVSKSLLDGRHTGYFLWGFTMPKFGLADVAVRRCSGHEHHEVSDSSYDYHWLAICRVMEGCGYNESVCFADCLFHMNARSIVAFAESFMSPFLLCGFPRNT